MTRILLLLVVFLTFPIRAALAQDTFFVQIEAQPNLLQAEERVRDYSASLPDVNGFSLPGGWYGIALGPYSEADALIRLRQLRNSGAIPRDSYVAASNQYRQQFWPVGANIARTLSQTPSADASTVALSPETVNEQAAEPAPEPVPVATPDETPRQARASEALLNRDEKRELQRMLQWAGFYSAAIDGSFGRGTRASMAAWQEANNIEPTGVLTTAQRALLLDQYNAVLEGVGLERVADSTTGIDMLVPKGLVAFETYQSPFGRYASATSDGVEFLQISQPGSQRTLFGLYDVLQTLEIVPTEGPRERRSNGFTITGENDRIVSHTEARLSNGEIKGFMLVWPAGDEERRVRALNEITDSFETIAGVMPLEIGADEVQSVDLVSGLTIRKPLRARSGFYVDGQGHVLTTAEAVQSCGSITLDGEYEAKITQVDTEKGLALLSPETALAPQAYAAFALMSPRLQAEIAVAGYSFEGVLGAPTMTFGTLADVRGLNGEEWLDRLTLSSLQGDVGGPVVDLSGGVVGLLQAADSAGRTLPEGVQFSTDTDAIRDMLNAAGVSPAAAAGGAALPAEDLTLEASAYTVLVSCWE